MAHAGAKRGSAASWGGESDPLQGQVGTASSACHRCPCSRSPASCRCSPQNNNPVLMAMSSAKSTGAGRKASEERCPAPRSGGSTLLLTLSASFSICQKSPSAPKTPQSHPAMGAGAPSPAGPETAIALRGGGQQHFHTDIFFHWLQFGAAKNQNKNGNIPFFWQKFNGGVVFFLVLVFSFFFFLLSLVRNGNSLP